MTDEPIDVDSREVPPEMAAAAAGLVPPAPLPVIAHVNTEVWTDKDNQKEEAVVVTLSTPAGLSYFYLTADGAQSLGTRLMRAGRQVAAREAVMKPKIIVPNGKVV